MTAKLFELIRECVAGKLSTDYVFTRQGRPIVDMRDAWAAACKEAGCVGLLFHDLRRTAARNLVRNGVPAKVAMKITGHRTSSMFQRYNITDGSDIREVTRKLEDAARKRRQFEMFESPGELFPVAPDPSKPN